jgi:hypothetical protein
MSAFGGKADIPQAPRMSAYDPKRTLTGHVMSFAAAAVSGAANGTSLIRNDRGDLGNKAGAALESHVAPQPGHGDYETIPDAN